MVSSSFAIFSSFSMQALQYAIEGLLGVSDKGVAKDILGASIGLAGLVVLAPPRGESKVVLLCCHLTYVACVMHTPDLP